MDLEGQLLQELVEQLLQKGRENPHGFTVFIKTLLPVKKGWAVALKETQNCFGREGLIKVIAVATEKTGVVGGWRDGEYYFDAVQIYENEEDATRAGIENEQIAIYQIETNRLKML